MANTTLNRPKIRVVPGEATPPPKIKVAPPSAKPKIRISTPAAKPKIKVVPGGARSRVKPKIKITPPAPRRKVRVAPGAATAQGRANIASAWFRSGRVYLPTEDMRIRPQITEALGEWLRFPTGKHDDCVDAMSMAICHLRRFGKASTTLGPARTGPRPKKVW